MKYDRVYTIGCFDYFHDGHKIILNKMRAMGKIIIVGIHDDKSLEKLKKLSVTDHQPIQERMKNLKPYADHLYIIPDTDPTFWLKCMMNTEDNKKTACFARGDDMPNFPGRTSIEDKINIKLLSYTKGVSSTMIRKTKNLCKKC